MANEMTDDAESTAHTHFHNNRSTDELLVFAMNFACRKHRFQQRKALEKDPLDGQMKQIAYIVHPTSVMVRVMESIDWDVFINNQKDGVKATKTEMLIAALFHDLIEDTATTYVEIGHFFGKRIADIVAFCTFVSGHDNLSKSEIKMQGVSRAKEMSDAARVIKMADLADNLFDLMRNPPPGWTPKRVQGYFVWKRETMKHLSQVKGADRLVKIIDAMLRNGKFMIDGVTYNTIPKDDQGQVHSEEFYRGFLLDYYKLVDDIEAKKCNLSTYESPEHASLITYN